MIKDTLTYDIVGSFLRPAEIITGRKGSGTRFEICNRRRIPPQVVAFGLAQRI